MVSLISANHEREYKCQTLTTSTQLSGLLESEPLTFTVLCASDHVQVENMETGGVLFTFFEVRIRYED